MKPRAGEQLEFASIAFPRDRKMLRAAEVAERLGVSVEHVIDLIEGGQLQAINVGDGSRNYWRVPVEGYEAFLAARHSFNV